ncbi:MAG TPA: SDR family NAD(P)-dependent oxidoreductase [Dehalococcoidia bacterium]|nr:SDR family NAD(P)-dependent oxidoreductase [Dehalococcoidia bacterium]
MDVTGKVALVTGGGSGIGRASALALARAGAAVLIADIDEEAATESARAITDAGGRAASLRTDVSSEADVRAAVAAAEERFGGLDIMHNNAGRLTGARFPEAPPELWLRTLQINIVGVLWGIYYAVPALKRRGGGVIVNTASISGLTPHFLDPMYAATKAAVVNLTRSLTFLQPEAGIRVNAVCPGLVETELSAHTRAQLSEEQRQTFDSSRAQLYARPHLSPEQVADAVMRLVTDESLNGRCYQVVPGREDEIL